MNTKKIILSMFLCFIFSFIISVYAESPYVSSNSSTSKTGVKIYYNTPIIQIDLQKVSIATASNLIFDINNILGKKIDFKISAISSGSAPTTANISYTSINGTEYESATLTSGTPITNTKSAFTKITIPMLNSSPVTITGNVRVYE